jgi:uncharacterized protein
MACSLRFSFTLLVDYTAQTKRMDIIKPLFWSKHEQRVRAGWRVLLYTMFWIFAPAVLNELVGRWLITFLLRFIPAASGLAPHVVAVVLKLTVVLVSTWFAAQVLDRRSVANLGLALNRTWWLDFGFGLVLGALLMTLIFLFEWLAGWVTITQTFRVAIPGISFWGGIMGAVLFFAVVSITEELLARGYQLRNFAEGLNSPLLGARQALILAWLLSSLLFGLLHIFNPNATWYTTLTLVLYGIFLGFGYVLTGSLAIPVGLHLTWNFFQGNVYGFPVSGNTFDSVTVLATQQTGPPLWTGGVFGPEAGLLGILASLLGIGLVVLWVRWQTGRVSLRTRLAEYQPAMAPFAHVGEKT